MPLEYGSSKKPRMVAKGKFPRKEVPCAEGSTEEDTGRNVADLVTSPAMAALRVINASEGAAMAETLDVPALLEVLRNQGDAVIRGDVARTEAMLVSQATALQTLFARLTEKALGAEYLGHFEAFMKLALRAQSQCRATLETLAAIKNPPVVYAQQANVTTGPQQINNGIIQPAQPRGIRNAQNQLSGESVELPPHTGTPTTASRANQAVEAMGEIHRAEDHGREDAIVTTRV